MGVLDAIQKVSVEGMVRVVGKVFSTGIVTIPGIGTGAAYTSGDAFGTRFTIQVPVSGIIHTALFVDKDDEGIETELVIFNDDFIAVADNAAFAVTDKDLENFIGTIRFVNFQDWTNNQSSTAAALGLTYYAPQRVLYIQAVTRGAPNIAAGSIPVIKLLILADE